MTDLQKEIWNVLTELSGEDVAKLLTDYHSNDLLSCGFGDHLRNEGYDIADTSDEADEEPTECTTCGDEIEDGDEVFMYRDGEKYYCSEACLHTDFTPEEWAEECREEDDDGNDCTDGSTSCFTTFESNN